MKSGKDWDEIARTDEIRTWEESVKQLSWRLFKFLVLVAVFIGIPLLTASYHMGWFQPDQPEAVRNAFLIGAFDVVLLLLLFHGTRWALIRKRRLARVSHIRDT